MTYNVCGGTLNLAQSQSASTHLYCEVTYDLPSLCSSSFGDCLLDLAVCIRSWCIFTTTV